MKNQKKTAKKMTTMNILLIPELNTLQMECLLLALPRVGQLWWPVSLLAMVGLVLILLGVEIYRKGKERHYNAKAKAKT
jgi:hypothetical protein